MTDPHPTPGPPTRGTLAREVALLLAVGLALGGAHNAFLLASGPGKGLAWIKSERRVMKLEDLAPAGPPAGPASSGEGSEAGSGPPAAPATAVTAAKPPAGTGQPATAPATAAATNPKPAPPADAPPASPAGAGTPAPASQPAPAAPDAPAIPESREPIEAGLGVVRRLHAAGAAVFVDARSAAEYAEGHIAGALNVPFDEVFRDPKRLDGLPDRGLPLVAYCSSVDCDLSRNLAFSLIDAGHRRVVVFPGGLREWQGAGLAVNRGAQP